MFQLSLEDARTLKGWFLPERPGRLLGLHIITTGCGSCWVDRFPNPTGVLVHSGFDYFLVGAPQAFKSRDIRGMVGWVDIADESLMHALDKYHSKIITEDRVALELTTPPAGVPLEHYHIRPLRPEDARHLESLSPEIDWISRSWGGPSGLANSRRSWGAFDHERLVSVACSYYVGNCYEDVGIVTEPDLRGRGLSAACAAKICQDIIGRGHRPSWLVASTNTASLRVAHKLGFSPTGNVRWYGCSPRRMFSTKVLRRVVSITKALVGFNAAF